MMPPKGIPANELWLAMSQMPRPHRVVDLPRKGENGKPLGQVAIRALTQAEQLQAGIEAEKLVRFELPNGTREHAGYEVAYSNAAAVAQLWRAVREVSDLDKPFAPSPKDMRAVFTTDEIGALYSSFLDVCAEIGPIIGALTKDECEAWIDRLIQGGEALDPLGFASPAVLRDLLKCSVGRLRNSQTAPSSVGSPADDTDSAMNDEEGI